MPTISRTYALFSSMDSTTAPIVSALATSDCGPLFSTIFKVVVQFCPFSRAVASPCARSSPYRVSVHEVAAAPPFPMLSTMILNAVEQSASNAWPGTGETVMARSGR